MATPPRGTQSTAAATPLQLRVTFNDTWATSAVTARPDESIASVKSRVLGAHNIAPASFGDYEVKHIGVPVRDESRSMSSLGIKNAAALIILPRRRRPVR